jgi:hypothetical protein
MLADSQRDRTSNFSAEDTGMSMFSARDSLKRGAPIRAPAPAAGDRQRIRNSAFYRPSLGAPFKRSEFLQALIDVAALIFGFLFVFVTAASIIVAFFLLMFCSF